MKNVFAVLFLSFAILAGCGTDTGNPSFTNNPNNGNETIRAGFVATSICKKIQTCDDTLIQDCEQFVADAPNVGGAMGANPASYPTLNAVIDGVSRKELTFDIFAAASCRHAIETLSCDDPLFREAAGTSVPHEFDNVYKFLRADPLCSRMISE